MKGMQITGTLKKITRYLLTMIVLTLLFQCKQKPHYQADIRGVDIEPVVINRYEELLFSINPYNLREEIDPHIETFRLFIGDEIDNPVAQQQLFDYMTDPLIIELYEETMAVWGDLSGLEAELHTAFRYYRSHFPSEPIPRMFSYVSGLDYTLPVKYAEHNMVVALDLYLGQEFQTYRQIGIPMYQAFRMAPAFLPVDIVRIMAEKHLQREAVIPETFLDYMVYEGKILYFIDCMLPAYHDSLKIGYTGEQLSWMEQNRGHVWSFYLQNEFLYSSDRQIITRFIGDAPFTSAFSRGSAPRTASWIGWQIVREYMRRHPDLSLQDLIQNHDSAAILSESRYRPR